MFGGSVKVQDVVVLIDAGVQAKVRLARELLSKLLTNFVAVTV
jgi:hypothetical protein